jgi:hypothetical protein
MLMVASCSEPEEIVKPGADTGTTDTGTKDTGTKDTGTPDTATVDSGPASATCTDNAKNGSETDVDCGGSCATKCADSKACAGAADCLNSNCENNVCAAPSCTDNAKNGTETDVDCGGACATKCADGKDCAIAADCTSTVCTVNKCLATALACVDTVKNGTETDVDCGGACATKCADTKSCKAAADCQGGTCTNLVCQLPRDCTEVKTRNAAAASGKFTIDPDGAGNGVAPFSVWCDMTTDGGAWTIVSSHAGLDNQQGFTGDSALTAGNPLNFEAWNLTRAQKVALSAIETESLFVRPGALWIKANRPMFDADLAVASKSVSYAATLTSSDGVVNNTTGRIGWSNYDISGGGDYGVITGNFDTHATNYRLLNLSCSNHYLYSYSVNARDGDAAYNVNTSLGAWTATNTCFTYEGGSMKVYAAMRR